MELLAVQVILVLLLREHVQPVGATNVSGFGNSVYVLFTLNCTDLIASPAVLLFVTRKVTVAAEPMGNSTDAGVCTIVNDRVASAGVCQKQTRTAVMRIKRTCFRIFFIRTPLFTAALSS